MNTEILTKLEKLLEADNIFSVQQEFKQLSAQFKNVIDHGHSEEEEEIDDEESEDAQYATDNQVNVIVLPNSVEIVEGPPRAKAETTPSEKTDIDPSADSDVAPDPSQDPDVNPIHELDNEKANPDPSQDPDVNQIHELDNEKTSPDPSQDPDVNPIHELEKEETNPHPSQDLNVNPIHELDNEKTNPDPSQDPNVNPIHELDNEKTSPDPSQDPDVNPIHELDNEKTSPDPSQDPNVNPIHELDNEKTSPDSNPDLNVNPIHELDKKEEVTEPEPISETFETARQHFASIQEKFKQRVEKARNERKRIEEETLQTAKDLLEELRLLVENEENIGKAFNGFNAIQDKWKSLPRVSNDAYRDLNIEYNKYAEQFFYNINIYKELKDLDLKHNLDQKVTVIEDQKKLLELKDIRRMEVEVRLNQDRWNEIGPTFKEDWEKIKDEFWNITRQIYKRIQDFYNERRAQQEANYEAKEALVGKLNHILSLNLKSHAKWKDKTKEVIDLQKQWKMVGYVPKEKVAIWQEFKKGCDVFFEKKREYHNAERTIQNTHREAKKNLLDQAEALKDSTDWKETSAVLIGLQKEWKNIGAANQRDENKLWRKFRGTCDHFFRNMKSHKSIEISEQKENLNAKQELLKKMEAFDPGSDTDENVRILKEFSTDWRAIGHVPFKAKDDINRTYKQLLDKKFKSLKIDKKEKEKIRFEQKLENIKVSSDGEGTIRREQEAIRGKITKLKSEKIQLENNMGFFANSKGANKFKAEIEQKVDTINDEIELLKNRLTLLRNV